MQPFGRAKGWKAKAIFAAKAANQQQIATNAAVKLQAAWKEKAVAAQKAAAPKGGRGRGQNLAAAGDVWQPPPVPPAGRGRAGERHRPAAPKGIPPPPGGLLGQLALPPAPGAVGALAQAQALAAAAQACGTPPFPPNLLGAGGTLAAGAVAAAGLPPGPAAGIVQQGGGAPLQFGGWHNTAATPNLAAALPIRVGSVVEVPTVGTGGAAGVPTIDGTALLEVVTLGTADANVLWFWGFPRGASSPPRGQDIQNLALGSNGNVLVHLCSGASNQCLVPSGGHSAWHVDSIRMRDPAQILESWAAPPLAQGCAAAGIGLASGVPPPPHKPALNQADTDKRVERLKKRLREHQAGPGSSLLAIAERRQKITRKKKKKKKGKRRRKRKVRIRVTILVPRIFVRPRRV